MALTAIILKVLIANFLAYSKPRNFKLLRNEMNEKAGF